MKIAEERALHDTLREVALTLIEIENRLYKSKLVKTAHAVNAVKQQLGWEGVEKLTQKKRRRP